MNEYHKEQHARQHLAQLHAQAEQYRAAKQNKVRPNWRNWFARLIVSMPARLQWTRDS